ncbi:putative transferase, protein kinase RLK-Pelle-WAK-LRK10L-1 family [Helianthus annuus]|uniref:non-specific serine/threonine protein kinase n=1 Tax=Helianthus annuus TaxID=4232 RepID=A0A251TTC7_HELAN|nr:putative transferase, protein kinase RLK-Pelle-WAK-LRK10L-1 family [Helianthus annuus]
MTVLRVIFSILVLHVACMIYAQNDQSGFISIDCGSESNYTQNGTGINYVSDDGFIEGGESYDLSRIRNYRTRVYNTLRSFPQNERNCYTLRPQKGKNNRYLIRAMFFYGESRGQPPQFDLHIGADYWATVYISDPSIYVVYEMLHLTSSDYIHVCLVNTARGDPFITSLELRPLDITMYKQRSPSSLILNYRQNFGTNETVRYDDDKYDRIWGLPNVVRVRAVQASDAVSLKSFSEEQVPLKVMSTAITPINSTELYYRWNATSIDEYIIYVHLAEVEILESNQKREFNIYNNGIFIGTFSPSTSITTIMLSSNSPTYELILRQTLNSTLPPILNAIEVYTLKQLLQNQTDDQDAAVMWGIKSTYGLTNLNWQGDPCVPQQYAWVGLYCNYNAPRAARIRSLNLSSRGLSGEIATALANLTMLDSLDLSNNNLTGNVPKFLAELDSLTFLNLMGNNFTRPIPAELLAKSKNGIEESSGEDKSSSTRIIAVILAPIIACIVVLSIIVFIMKQPRKKALIKSEEVLTPRKQQFTYSEVLSITNNFQKEIGRGGFGRVFQGSVGDNQVAVKMLSESSSQGYKEFQAEVKLLMEVRHTNITSLVGYCDDNNHKGIIYDFMANGNLGEHLFDGRPNVLSWERRLQIGCDAADEMNEGFQAKLADFGLSRAYPTEDASHASSVKVAGTIGYLDPEYHSTGRLTEKSDVYSFGVLLLELITGRRAITEGVNIVNWVQSLVEEGNVEAIIDSRLEGHFDINTAWKGVETAIACVCLTSVERPTMNDVAMDLKHCVQTEKTRQSGYMSLNLEGLNDLKPR